MTSMLEDDAFAPYENEDAPEHDDEGQPMYGEGRAIPLSASAIRRDELLRRVLFQELSPPQAELECEPNELAPFMVTPEEMKIWALPELWSPEMTAIWIKTRDPVRVQRHIDIRGQMATAWALNNDGYHEGQAQLISRVSPNTLFRPDSKLAGGYSLIALKKTHLFQSYYEFNGNPGHFPDIEEWYPDWQKLLVKGGGEAWGLNIADGAVTEISKQSWMYATFSEDEAGETVLCIGGKPWLHRVHFRGVDVLNEYRPNEIPKFRGWIPVKSYAGTLRPSEQWLLDEMKQVFPEGFPLYFRTKIARNREILARIVARGGDVKYANAENANFIMLVDRMVKGVFGDDWPRWMRVKF